ARELASSADGRVEIILGSGRLANSRVDLLFNDIIAQLFTDLNPFARTTDYTEVDCGIMRAQITSGQATIDPLILQTRQLVVASSGTIRLDKETIDLAFNTRPRKGVGISAGMVINPFVKLAGTLEEPTISLDASSAVVSGGAAVVTSGLSLIGKSLFDRYFRGTDPCGEAEEVLRRMWEAAETKSAAD
ncbi:MAG: hypothetical protein R3212_04185, partial [Xanthomonadales bacterium]|nr:hypothetical protein [Xanthomonadales bacterium]